MAKYNEREFRDVKVPDGAIVMGRVDVVMYMMPDGGDILVATRTDDGHGDRLPMVNTFGMLEMAKKVISDVSEPAQFVEDEDE